MFIISSGNSQSTLNLISLNIFETNLTGEPYVQVSSPVIARQDEEGDLLFSIITSLDQNFNSDLFDAIHLFELDNGSFVLLGNGNESLNDDPELTYKVGDIYSLIFDENFCLDNGNCLESGTNNLTNSIELNQDEFIYVWPNPTEELIYFRKTKYNSFEFQIFTESGGVVAFGKNKDKVDVSNLRSGIYVLKIWNGNSKPSFSKFVKI